MAVDPQREQLLRLVESRADIDGRFTDLRRVGSQGGYGNFSMIFSGFDNATHSRVAIKVCHPDADPYRKLCFEREEDLLRRFQSQPDVIGWVGPRSRFVEPLSSTTGVRIDLTLDYYPMELAATDVESITYSGRWTPEQRLVAFRQACRGVQRLHRAGVAHRDLKPSNLLVMADGSARVSDLGTARDVRDDSLAILSVYDAPPGDIRYMAPEMVACLHDVDAGIALVADMFGLGAILFELFAGTQLFGQLWDPSYLTGLRALAAVRRSDRLRIYEQVVPQIAERPLPSAAAFGWFVPPSIRDRVNDLYRALAELDYRRRLTSFESVFRQIEICLVIVRNEEKYRRWMEARDRRRAHRDARRLGTARLYPVRQGRKGVR